MDGPNGLGGIRSSSSKGRLTKFNPNNTPQRAKAFTQPTGQPTGSAGAASASSRVRAGEFSGRTGQSSFDKQRSFDPNAPAGSGGRAQSYINNRRNPQESYSDMSTNTNNHANEFSGGAGMKPREKAPHDNMYSEVPKVAGEPGSTGALAGGGTPKYNTPHLQFPSDVGAEPGMGNQGHYILFMINETKDAQIMATQQSEHASEFATADGNVSKLYDDIKRTNPTLTKKQLSQWNVVLEKAGKIRDSRQSTLNRTSNLAPEQIASTSRITKADIEASGGKKIFSEFAQSYKIVPVWDEVSEQKILGSAKELGRYLADEGKGKASQVFHKGSKGKTNAVKRKETVRLAGGISLYMPPSITTTSTAEYTDSEIGVGAALASAFLDEFKATGASGIGDNVTARLNQLGPEAKEGLQNLALKSIGVIPGLQGADVVRDLRRGFIKAPRMELAFKGIGKRNFSYEFKMIPKSREEADIVREIVKTFRANMLPEFLKGTDRSARFFKMPNTFDISYMYNGGQNQYLHLISTCVCKSVTATYGGDRYKTFDANDEGAPPVETNISLQFEELEIITKERVMEGY